MKSFEQIARAMYTAYLKKAGGKAFDGKPLPSFEQLGAERRECWIAAAQEAAKQISEVH